MIRIDKETSLHISGDGDGLFESIIPVRPTWPMSDSQVKLVYKAEEDAEDMEPFMIKCSHDELMVGAVAKFMLTASHSEIVRMMFGDRNVVVTVKKNKRMRSMAFCGEMTIVDHGEGVSAYEVVHELAHALQRGVTPHHGAVFASIYLMLAKEMMPHKCYKALLNAFNECGVDYAVINMAKMKKATCRKKVKARKKPMMGRYRRLIFKLKGKGIK